MMFFLYFNLTLGGVVRYGFVVVIHVTSLGGITGHSNYEYHALLMNEKKKKIGPEYSIHSLLGPLRKTGKCHMPLLR